MFIKIIVKNKYIIIPILVGQHQKFKKFIYELDEINQIICKIEKLLKHNGLSKDTAKNATNF